MALVYEAGLVRFEDHCTVEEALPFTEYLRETPAARVSLAACASMHASLLQVLIAGRPVIIDYPAEPPLGPALRRLFGED